MYVHSFSKHTAPKEKMNGEWGHGDRWQYVSYHSVSSSPFAANYELLAGTRTQTESDSSHNECPSHNGPCGLIHSFSEGLGPMHCKSAPLMTNLISTGYSKREGIPIGWVDTEATPENEEIWIVKK